MTIEEFAAITQDVIAEDGFDGFLPTACYPGRQEVVALQGLPADVEPEPAVLRWVAKRAAPTELHLVACRSGPAEFTVIRVRGAERESAVFAVSQD
jgi:hypothetical protein